jgi:protein TonB
MVAIAADAPSRWWLSSVAALAAHGAVLLGMPDAPAARIEQPAPLWMSLVTHEQSGTTAEASGGTAVATATSVTTARPTPTRRRAAVAHARTSVSTHVPTSEPASVAAESFEVASKLSEAETSETALEGGAERGEGAGGSAGSGSGAGTGAGGVGAGLGAGNAMGLPSTRPALIASHNPCLGFFPAGAHVDHGSVQIQVRVDETGHARMSEVVVEAPAGHDFGRAARACASALRFAPARNSLGMAVAGDAKLELHFHRS